MTMFKRKPIERVEVGGFIFEWYFKENNIEESYLEISTVSGIWSMRMDARCDSYGYLIASARQGNIENVHGYAALCYIISQELTHEQGFCDDITKSVQKLQRRSYKRGERNAKDITHEQEQADEAFMSEVAAYADATPKERKQMRQQWRKDMKEEIRKINKDEKL